jgi:hypothetical protein
MQSTNRPKKISTCSTIIEAIIDAKDFNDCPKACIVTMGYLSIKAWIIIQLKIIPFLKKSGLLLALFFKINKVLIKQVKQNSICLSINVTKVY